MVTLEITETLTITKTIRVMEIPEGVALEDVARAHLNERDEWLEWNNGWEPMDSEGLVVEEID